MSNRHPQFGIAMTSVEYADEWARSAAAFRSAGHYAWMNQQLGNAMRVVEIGCGSGASTEVLAAPGRQVLCVESNASCIQSTQAYLKNKGINSDSISQQQCQSLANWAGSQVKLLEADILSPDLIEQLPSNAFDAIICWMIGSHPEHIGDHLKKPYLELGGSEMAGYRTLIHRRAYELGRRVLSPSGLVQIVDRGGIRSWSDKDQMRRELAARQVELASPGYEINREGCFLRKLTEGLNQSSIQYVANIPQGFTGVLVLMSSKARRM
jgi:SAM-dependent methyltransferase